MYSDWNTAFSTTIRAPTANMMCDSLPGAARQVVSPLREPALQHGLPNICPADYDKEISTAESEPIRGRRLLNRPKNISGRLNCHYQKQAMTQPDTTLTRRSVSATRVDSNGGKPSFSWDFVDDADYCYSGKRPLSAESVETNLSTKKPRRQSIAQKRKRPLSPPPSAKAELNADGEATPEHTAMTSRWPRRNKIANNTCPIPIGMQAQASSDGEEVTHSPWDSVPNRHPPYPMASPCQRCFYLHIECDRLQPCQGCQASEYGQKHSSFPCTSLL